MKNHAHNIDYEPCCFKRNGILFDYEALTQFMLVRLKNKVVYHLCMFCLLEEIIVLSISFKFKYYIHSSLLTISHLYSAERRNYYFQTF